MTGEVVVAILTHFYESPKKLTKKIGNWIFCTHFVSAHKRCFMYITYILGRVFCLEISCFMLCASNGDLLNNKKVEYRTSKRRLAWKEDKGE